MPPSESSSPDSSADKINPKTRPMSKRTSKIFLTALLVTVFGLGTVGSYFLVDIAETALDQPSMNDSTATDTGATGNASSGPPAAGAPADSVRVSP